MLVGDEQRWPGNPRPQVGCDASTDGVFFWYGWNGAMWESFDYTTWPSKNTARIFNFAADIKIVFMSIEGGVAEYELSVENSLYDKYCVQPLCLRL
jgi:hypothetical protein